ncbi:MAG: hypothetical protein GKC04_03270 [Methanomicrobiales archaeon]|nr:hypothetical protein [Methanomicrobiales archaeon]
MNRWMPFFGGRCAIVAWSACYGTGTLRDAGTRARPSLYPGENVPGSGTGLVRIGTAASAGRVRGLKP